MELKDLHVLEMVMQLTVDPQIIGFIHNHELVEVGEATLGEH
jgi:hypothetical protein